MAAAKITSPGYEALRESERREQEVTALLATAGDELMTCYFNRFMTHGEAGAQVMLLELIKEGNRNGPRQ